MVIKKEIGESGAFSIRLGQGRPHCSHLSKNWKEERAFHPARPRENGPSRGNSQCKGLVAIRRPSCSKNSREAGNRQEEPERHGVKHVRATKMTPSDRRDTRLGCVVAPHTALTPSPIPSP